MLRLVVVTCLVAAVLSYGTGHVQKSGSGGCSNPAGCASPGRSSLGTQQVSANSYWWYNKNPFVNAPQRGPTSTGGSKRPAGSKRPSVGSSGFGGAGGVSSFIGGSQGVRGGSFVGPMGICPRNFICVHWQLCRDGQVIIDGQGIIDKSKRRPSQGSKLRRCGDDMDCCGVTPGYTTQGVFNTLMQQQSSGSSQTSESAFGTNSLSTTSHLSSQGTISQNVPSHASSTFTSSSASNIDSVKSSINPAHSEPQSSGVASFLDIDHSTQSVNGNFNAPESQHTSNAFPSSPGHSLDSSSFVNKNNQHSLTKPHLANSNLNVQSHTSKFPNPSVQRESVDVNTGVSPAHSVSVNNIASGQLISGSGTTFEDISSYLPPNETPHEGNIIASGPAGTSVAQEDIRISSSHSPAEISPLKPIAAISNFESGLQEPAVPFSKPSGSSLSQANVNQPLQSSANAVLTPVSTVGSQGIESSNTVHSLSSPSISVPSQENTVPSLESISSYIPPTDEFLPETHSDSTHSSQRQDFSPSVLSLDGQVSSSINPSNPNILPQIHGQASQNSGSLVSSSLGNQVNVQGQAQINFPTTQSSSVIKPSHSSIGSGHHSTHLGSSPIISTLSGVKSSSSLSSHLSSTQPIGQPGNQHHATIQTSTSSGVNTNIAADRTSNQVPDLESGYLPPSVSSEGASSVVSEQSNKPNVLDQGVFSGSRPAGSISSISSQGGSQGSPSFPGSSLKPLKPVSGVVSSGSFGQSQISGGSYNPSSSGSAGHQGSSSGSFIHTGASSGSQQQPGIGLPGTSGAFPQQGSSGCVGGSSSGCGGYTQPGSSGTQQGSRFPSSGSGVVSGSISAGGQFGQSSPGIPHSSGGLSSGSGSGGSSGTGGYGTSGSASSTGGFGSSAGGSFVGSAGGAGSFPGSSGTGSSSFPGSSGSLGNAGSSGSGGYEQSGSFPSSSGSVGSSVGGNFGGSTSTFPGGSGGSTGSFPSGGFGGSSGGSSGGFGGSSGGSSGSFGGSSGGSSGGFGGSSGGSSGGFGGSSGGSSGGFGGSSGGSSGGFGSSSGGSSSGFGGSSGGSSAGYPSSSGGVSGSIVSGSGGSSGSFPGGAGSRFPSSTGVSSGGFPSGSGSFPGSSGSGSGSGTGGYGPSGTGAQSNQPVNPGPGGPFNQLGLPSQPGPVGGQQNQPMSQMMMGMMGMNGNPLVPGSCSAGTFCVPRFQCNPYNGFIIMNPNQLQAVWPDAPQVPLLDCIIPAGVLNDGVCCQQQHPIVGPNGQILD